MANEPQVWANGGDSLSAPENTIPAYWGALAAGADGLVVGVQLTADKQVACCSQPNLKATCGDPRAVAKVKLEQLEKLDAGSQFESINLDRNHQPVRNSKGKGKPWKGGMGDDGKFKGPALYHPSLSELCLKFGRQTQLLLQLVPEKSEARNKLLVKQVMATLKKFGLDRTTLIAGNAATLKLLGRKAAGQMVLIADSKQSAEAAAASAKDASASYLWINAENTGNQLDAVVGDLRVFVGSEAMPFALTPKLQRSLARQSCVAGFVTRAVHHTMDVQRPRCLVFEDRFTKLNENFWTMGYSKPNQDTRIWMKNGLHIEIKEGGEYSGAAALTTFSISGSFDAQMDFTVANPHQGTTFELAAIQVDPGYHHPNNEDLKRGTVNLTFDVHGAPPYASSERDENDGFRLGWNNGPAVTDFAADPDSVLTQLLSTALQSNSPKMLAKAPPGYIGKVAQSSNIYNKYCRDVGEAIDSNSSGQLRLVRNGAHFSAYYTDRYHKGWVLCGTARVPTLCNEIFLRIGAKHWPKRGIVPPWNNFTFKNFKLYQRRL